MRRSSFLLRLVGLVLAAALLAGCDKKGTTPDPTPTPGPETPERTGESGISYQMLVYSFADSDGDGCGDFKGIQSRLDYLKEMGVQAIWLSPIHPASSYHGYDVLDYSESIPTMAPRPTSNPFWTRHTPRGSRSILTMC